MTEPCDVIRVLSCIEDIQIMGQYVLCAIMRITLYCNRTICPGYIINSKR